MVRKLSCAQCGVSEICLPFGLGAGEIARLDHLIRERRRVKRGEHLFRAGDSLHSLYAIRLGFFKNYVLHEDGREQVTGFHMAGEVIGMDAIGLGAHACHAVALEDSELCELPFAQLEQLGREIPALQRQIHRIMSREIVRDQGVMLLLGTMRAEERVAALLLNLSQRYQARGFSPDEFRLRMTREEIGSYLGMKLETVSRVLSKFQEGGLITVQNKTVQLNNIPALKRVLGQGDCPAPRNQRTRTI